MLKLKNRFWIETENGKLLGSGRVELLQKIHNLGSINKAASAMNMAYRKAWGLCKSMNELSEKPLIVQKTGGKHGGGTILTEEGHKAIHLYEKLTIEFQEFVRQANEKLNHP